MAFLSAEEKEHEVLRPSSTRELSQKGAYYSKNSSNGANGVMQTVNRFHTLIQDQAKIFLEMTVQSLGSLMVGKSTTSTRDGGSNRYINR